MSQSGEVADLVVKEGIQVTESATKLAALGAKNLAAIVLAMLKEDNKLQGMTNLKQLIRSDKPLCILQINEKDLAQFNKESKKYGVLFTAVKDKTGNSGLCDIIAKQDDVTKINYIIEKLGLNAPEAVQEQTKDKSTDKAEDAPEASKDKSERAKDKDKSSDRSGISKDQKNSPSRESGSPSEKRYTARKVKVDKEDLDEAKTSVKERIREIKAMKNPTADKIPDLIRAQQKANDKIHKPRRAVKAKLKNAAKEVTDTAKQTVQTSKADKGKER